MTVRGPRVERAAPRYDIRASPQPGDARPVSCSMQRSLQTTRRTRGSRGRTVVVLALVGLQLPAAASAAPVPEPGQRAGSVRAANCTMKGAKTIAVNRHVRVFSARVRTWREVFGCRRSANRAYVIGDAGGECHNYDLIDSAVVAGNFVALNVRTCDLDGSQSSVALINLRDGRVRFASAPLSTRGSDASYDAIRGMVVTAGGRLAWLGVRVARGAVVDAEVRRRGIAAKVGSVVLDSGSTIDPRSLRRRGSTLSWRKSGVTRYAAI